MSIPFDIVISLIPTFEFYTVGSSAASHLVLCYLKLHHFCFHSLHRLEIWVQTCLSGREESLTKSVKYEGCSITGMLSFRQKTSSQIAHCMQMHCPNEKSMRHSSTCLISFDMHVHWGTADWQSNVQASL